MNSTALQVMAPAFFECLVLVGIHSYLGLHVIRRKVIFVDLALAQIAALGTTVGFLFGILPDTVGAYWFSLGFTFIGAAVFSVSRFRNEKIPQEAIIGLTYAVAAAVAILVIDKAPQGAEHLKEILTGSILWVEWSTILKAALVYSVVGAFHYVFRKKFLLISENPEEAFNQGLSVRFWDFLFYLSFGIVITHSVSTAGVLLVFIFLVVPAVASMMITDILWKQLMIGWGLGLFVSIAGLFVSYQADLPSGPAVVASYAIMLILISLFLFIRRAEVRKKAALKVASGLAVTITVVGIFYGMGYFLKEYSHEHHHEGMIDTREHLIHEAEVHKKLDSMSEDELRRFLKSIHDIEILRGLFQAQISDYIHFRIAERLFEIDTGSGLKYYVNILETAEVPFFREEVLQKLTKETGMDFGYDPLKTGKENSDSLKKFRTWIENKYKK